LGGQYGALLELLEASPRAKTTVLLGDLVDRGTQSREVVEWAINRANVVTLKGNHEDMMVDFLRGTRRYDEGCWMHNGGFQTCVSYGLPTRKRGWDDHGIREDLLDLVPESHVAWMEQLPRCLEGHGVFASHAPWNNRLPLATWTAPTADGYNPIPDELWNRSAPIRRDRFQVFGHNSHMGLTPFGDYAMCIDDSGANRMLTSFSWPDRTVTQVQFGERVERLRPAERSPFDSPL
jgi:hypothetical protein